MTRPAAILLRSVAAALVITSAARAQDSAPAKTPAQVDAAVFSNGDSLVGEMLGCDKDGLHWKTAYGQSVLVTTKYLTGIRLRERKPPADIAKYPWTALLVNGDMLPGSLVSMDEKALVLDTWYAGRLSIPRAMLVALGKAGFPYQGPTGLDGWVSTPANGPGWTYADGAFSTAADAAIGRPITLPTRSSIQFDALPHAFWLDVYLGFDQSGKIGRSYLVEIDFAHGRGGYISLYEYESGVKRRVGQVTPFGDQANENMIHLSLGSGPGTFLPRETVVTTASARPVPSGPTRFEIRIDKKARSIAVLADGKPVRQDAGLDDLTGLGSLIFTPGESTPTQFSSLNNPGAPGSPPAIPGDPASQALMRISSIQAGIWNDATAGANDEGVCLANGDPMPGKIGAIADGKINIVTQSGSAAALGLDGVDAIYLSPSPDAKDAAQRGPSAVRATIAGGGVVNLEFESWANGRATVTSPDFGKATFSADFFQRLEFNHDGDPAPDQPASK